MISRGLKKREDYDVVAAGKGKNGILSAGNSRLGKILTVEKPLSR